MQARYDRRVNYFAHALPSLRFGDAWLVAGTALPDWLRVAGRRLRASPDAAAAAADGPDRATASLARGVLVHFDDDRAFHACTAFTGAAHDVADLVRAAASGTDGVRPSFVAHLLVEMLLDSELSRARPGALDRWYSLLATLDPADVERRARGLATGPCDGLARLVRAFVEARFVADYEDDARLLRRLDAVLRRTRQSALAGILPPVLPRAREVVASRAEALLAAGRDPSARAPL